MGYKKFELHLLDGHELPFIFNRMEVKMSRRSAQNGMNWHPNIEILRVCSGEGTVICGNTEHGLHEGDVFVVNSNLAHAIFSETGIGYYYLIIDSEFCLENDIDTEKLVFRETVNDAGAVSRFDNATEEFLSENSYKTAGIRLAVLDLMLYIARNYTESKTVEPAVTSEGIKYAISFITSHFDEKLSLDRMSKEAGLSKYYFINEFKRYTGFTPTVYLNKIRCENAKKHLLAGIRVKETGEMCGFEDGYYFSKVFRSLEGCSPTDFVKSCNRPR